MFVNVWGIIWRNQKTVIASAAQVRAGGEALPEAAAAGRAAGMASRQNVLFSFTMIWFMTFTCALLVQLRHVEQWGPRRRTGC